MPETAPIRHFWSLGAFGNLSNSSYLQVSRFESWFSFNV